MGDVAHFSDDRWVSYRLGPRRGRSVLTAVVVLAAILPLAQHSLAQGSLASPGLEDAGQAEVSRDEWRERVNEAGRRAREVGRERRLHPELYAAPLEDSERVVSERVLNDDSLQRGDIVSTKKGLFVFQGRPDQQHRMEDFIALPSR